MAFGYSLIKYFSTLSYTLHYGILGIVQYDSKSENLIDALSMC